MELYRQPATPFVAGFIGSPKMNLFEGELAARNGCDLFGIRPEHIDLGKAGGAWKGRVHHMERLGSDAIVYLDADGVGPLTVRTDGETDVSDRRHRLCHARARGASTVSGPAPGSDSHLPKPGVPAKWPGLDIAAIKRPPSASVTPPLIRVPAD